MKPFGPPGWKAEAERQRASESDARRRLEKRPQELREAIEGIIVAACERNQYSRALGERMEALEREREEIEGDFAAVLVEDNALRLHPNLSKIHGRKVAALTKSLNDAEIRLEAAEVLREPHRQGGADAARGRRRGPRAARRPGAHPGPLRGGSGQK